MEIAQPIEEEFLYLQVTNHITRQIQQLTLKTGDKLPSLRALSKEKGISLTTAYKAYAQLEMNGLIEARPKSGYYVRYTPVRSFGATSVREMPVAPDMDDEDELINIYWRNFGREGMVKFSLAGPDISLLPQAKLNKSMMEAIRLSPTSCMEYEEFQGNSALRTHIARQTISWGGNYSADEIVTTQGCKEALVFCLKATTQPGDLVAIESPAYFGIINLIQSLGLKILEIPAEPLSGINLQYLSDALEKYPVKACVFVPTFSNPSGFCMTNESKKDLVNLLSAHKIPLIEDDIYGEMYFGRARPRTCKSYDKEGLVLLCASVSKSLAPGYRVGWCIPGKYKSEVLRLKSISTVSSATPTQAAIANFFETGRYDLHMRNLRKTLHTQCLRYTQAIAEYFPAESKVSRPDGGYVLWVKLPRQINALEVSHLAAAQHISIAPGHLFNIDRRYSEYIRISFGIPYNEKIEISLKMLGAIIYKLLEAPAKKNTARSH